MRAYCEYCVGRKSVAKNITDCPDCKHPLSFIPPEVIPSRFRAPIAKLVKVVRKRCRITRQQSAQPQQFQ